MVVKTIVVRKSAGESRKGSSPFWSKIKSMYEDYLVRGPYVNREGRKFVILVDKDKKTKSTQYCRYLMEVYLNRELRADEEVHHIDGNFINDYITNLEVVDATKHRRHHMLKETPDIEVTCVECGKSFLLNKKQQRYRKYNSIDKAGPFCSRSCSGKYGARLQNSSEEDKNRESISKRNTSGFRGVRKVKNRWKSEIYYDGRKHHLGYFNTPEEASERYKEEVKKISS